MIVKIVGWSRFLEVPDHLGQPAENQDKGTELERLIECAGRTCYDSYGKGRSSEEYHKHILEVGHGSVLEHASISFYISSVSRGCTHEHVRHRVGLATSQRSTRYVDESESEWCWHPLIEDAEPIARMEVEEAAKELYTDLVEVIQTRLVEKGVNKLTARKQARGAARGALGNALSTSLIWTANIRTLRGYLEQRATEHADAEIRLLANRIYENCLTLCPAYFKDYEVVSCPDGIGYGLTTRYRKI